MKIYFTETGWKDYLYWEGQDKKTLKQINNLIADIERNGYDRCPSIKKVVKYYHFREVFLPVAVFFR